MTDIVERLRHGGEINHAPLGDEAADEIERLREAIRMMVRLDKCASPDVYRIAREALGEPTPTAEPDAGS